MSGFDDSNSFLFGLNHFNSPQPSSSNAAHAGENQQQNGTANTREGGSSNLLDGLDAFPGAPAGEQQGNDLLEGGSFAEQLALWTNANFSFDGPTGHALLGDEEKDKDKDADKDGDEDAAGNGDVRAGKRVRNLNAGKSKNGNNANDGLNDVAARGLSNAVRNGKNRLRDENDVAVPHTPIEIRRSNPEHQNSNTGGPDRSRANSQLDGRPQPNSFSQHSNGHAFGNGIVPPYNGPTPNSSSTPQTPFTAPTPAPQAPVDLSQLLALQQLLSSNPLALASLGNFSGLAPQLSALGNQLGSGLNGQVLQQLQQQLQAQQAQQQQHAPSNASQFPTAPAFSGWGFPGQFGQPSSGAGAPYSGMSNGIHNGFTGGPINGASHSAPSSHDDEDSSRSGNDKESKLTAQERAELHARRAEDRDNIPPLKLIDTGNPEADAESNRVAIEEDKRRRNTAASARFRMKKKQREAALEGHTKGLENQLAEVRQELEKLRNENTWLKGLIQVRTGDNNSDAAKVAVSSGKHAAGQNSAAEALQAAQQLQALQHAVSTQQATQAQLQAHMQHNGSGPRYVSSPDATNKRSRDHGIQPRGVGTKADHDGTAAGHKRDRED